MGTQGFHFNYAFHVLLRLQVYMRVHTHSISFIHSSFDGHLGCFHILAVVNNAAMNFGVHVSFCICVFRFFGYVYRRGITESR